MANAINIEKLTTGKTGRYVARVDGVEGELVFTIRGPALISADHTFVPASMRGSGAASCHDAMQERMSASTFRLHKAARPLSATN